MSGKYNNNIEHDFVQKHIPECNIKVHTPMKWVPKNSGNANVDAPKEDYYIMEANKNQKPLTEKEEKSIQYGKLFKSLMGTQCGKAAATSAGAASILGTLYVRTRVPQKLRTGSKYFDGVVYPFAIAFIVSFVACRQYNLKQNKL
ncbi:2 TM domain-containing transmembrane protein [Acrasis kona]|uniref:2 TM domain-containing transmembrane protein n=1 Tax=Acrasis kona TaxID=1008807 RepID=A0AAW2ZDH5_9EUKA